MASLTVASAGISEKGLGARCTASAALALNVVELGAVGSGDAWQPVIGGIFGETAICRVTGCWRGGICAR
jgi:hypothetical protein